MRRKTPILFIGLSVIVFLGNPLISCSAAADKRHSEEGHHNSEKGQHHGEERHDPEHGHGGH